MPEMTHGDARPVKVHTQFKREPINAGLTFMVIYSCFCACFCSWTSLARTGSATAPVHAEAACTGAQRMGGCLDARGAARWLGPL